ncbi:MAG: UbiA family prenyltransferase [Armatimonadetes bacterium]|nr:UbiA family prenyltransferase [Akkermansiaceae bacterium]
MNSAGKIYALLATARIANVPSVVSNLGAGVLLGCARDGNSFTWPWALTASAVLLYISGNFFNDWADLDWDRVNRPERALPQGMFGSSAYFAIGLVGTLAGLALAARYGWAAMVVALILAGFIAFYTKIHKKTALSVVPMGLCRACLPILGYVAMRGGFSGAAAFPAFALLMYIVALSLSARWESKGDVPREKKWQARGLLFAGGLIAAALPLLINPVLGWIGLVPFGLWLILCLTKYQSPVSDFVSALLAGIPLVDWVLTLPMALIWLQLQRVETSDAMFLTAVLLPPACFMVGRAIQRLSPAT